MLVKDDRDSEHMHTCGLHGVYVTEMRKNTRYKSVWNEKATFMPEKGETKLTTPTSIKGSGRAAELLAKTQ